MTDTQGRDSSGTSPRAQAQIRLSLVQIMHDFVDSGRGGRQFSGWPQEWTASLPFGFFLLQRGTDEDIFEVMEVLMEEDLMKESPD